MSISEKRQGHLIQVLALERRNSFRRELRDELKLQSKAIELENKPHLNLEHEPLHPERPYGLLPSFQESGIKDVWEKILKFVNDDDEDINNMYGICSLFRNLLEETQRLATLLKAVKICFLRYGPKGNLKLILPEDVLHFRLVSRTSKRLFDKIFRNETSDVFTSCFSNWKYVVPGFDLDVNDTEGQQRLQKMVAYIEKEKFPNGTLALTMLKLDEKNVDDIGLVRVLVQKLFGLGGDSIRSLTYFTDQGSHQTYCILRKWIPLLPNLEEMTIGIRSESIVRRAVQVPEKFPTAPRLTTFFEDKTGGFSTPHLLEILRANPTISCLKIAPYPENRLHALLASEILRKLPLQAFLCVHDRQKPLLKLQFKWPLTSLKLGVENGSADAISSTSLFKFVNSFGTTLDELLVDLNIRDDGGMLELPNLTRLVWWLGSRTDRFDFTIPLRNLECLEVYVPAEFSDRANKVKTRTMSYLKKYHFPSLFPAIRWIAAGKHFDTRRGLEIVWEVK